MVNAPYLSQLAVGKDNHFNLIRFVAALAVLWSHSFALLGSTEPFSLLGRNLGGMAVDVFFVTSGFLVTSSLLRSADALDFLIARILRIYPALWAMLVLSLPLLAYLFSPLSIANFFQHSQTLQYLVKASTLLGGVDYFLPGVFAHNPYPYVVNGSLWTMSYELGMYLGLLGLWFVFHLFHAYVTRVIAGFIALSAIIVLFVGVTPLLDWHTQTLLRFAYLFFAGAAAYLLRDFLRMSRVIAVACVFVLLLAALYASSYFAWLFMLLMPYIVLYLAYVPKGPLLVFNRLGDYSYGIYIYAFPIQQSLVAISSDRTWWQLSLSASCLTVLCAFFSWHYLEQPLLGQRDRIRRGLVHRAGI